MKFMINILMFGFWRHLYSSYRTDGVTIATANTAVPNIELGRPFGDALNRTIHSTRTTLNTRVIYIKL